MFVQETQLTFLFQNEENLDKLDNVDDENGDEDNDDVVVASANDVEGDLTANFEAVNDEILQDGVQAELNDLQDGVEAVRNNFKAEIEEINAELSDHKAELNDAVEQEVELAKQEVVENSQAIENNLSENFNERLELAEEELTKDVETVEVIKEVESTAEEVSKISNDIASKIINTEEAMESANSEEVQLADTADTKSITSERSIEINKEASAITYNDHASVKSEDPPSSNSNFVDDSPNHRPLTFTKEPTEDDIFVKTNNDKIALDPKVDILIIERNNDLNEAEDTELENDKNIYDDDYEYDDNDDVILSHERNLSAENNPIETGESTKEVSV